MTSPGVSCFRFLSLWVILNSTTDIKRLHHFDTTINRGRMRDRPEFPHTQSLFTLNIPAMKSQFSEWMNLFLTFNPCIMLKRIYMVYVMKNVSWLSKPCLGVRICWCRVTSHFLLLSFKKWWISTLSLSVLPFLNKGSRRLKSSWEFFSGDTLR